MQPESRDRGASDPTTALPKRSGPRIGLVLGAGGPVGHAYHAGVLRALQHALDWDARSAEVVVGTSAGAQVGALVRAGMDADDLAARASGEPMSAAGEAIARHYVRPSHDKPDGPRRPLPASRGYLMRSLRRPWQARPGRVVSALLPEGRVSLEPQVAGLRRVFGTQWPERRLWITAVQLGTGKVVAFGAPGAPQTDVGTAVASSGAVPGVVTPVRVEGRRYVDGGVASATHLDLLQEPLDLVLVSSPLSMFRPMRALLRLELARLARRGTPVVTFEPTDAALRAMGRNPMALERSASVARAAYETTVKRIESTSGGSETLLRLRRLA